MVPLVPHRRNRNAKVKTAAKKALKTTDSLMAMPLPLPPAAPSPTLLEEHARLVDENRALHDELTQLSMKRTTVVAADLKFFRNYVDAVTTKDKAAQTSLRNQLRAQIDSERRKIEKLEQLLMLMRSECERIGYCAVEAAVD